MNRLLEKIIQDKPVGLDRSVGRLISQHVGLRNGITREELLQCIRSNEQFKRTMDRHMRISIQYYRSLGIRVCHAEVSRYDPKKKKNVPTFLYYLAENEQEYQEFRAMYMKYAKTIWENTKAMDQQAEVHIDTNEEKPPKPVEIQRALPFPS